MISLPQQRRSMIRRTVPVASVLMGMLLCSPQVYAQASAPGTTAYAADSNKVPHADTDFLKDVAHANQAELEAARQAANKASNTEVKAYAQTMLDEHGKLGKDLSALAASKNVSLPTEPSLIDKGKLKVLGMRDNASFDKHYVNSMGIDAHEDAIKRFQKEINDGKDAEVKAFASNNLANLQRHLQMAKDLKAKLNLDK